ncbi:MAG TPA: outer membrane lipoprotein carrier protein LolA [Treponemataceae bacterium]|nr:outer membrane lipoprotein carrier protein LolA [Treponemataceae bacterium]
MKKRLLFILCALFFVGVVSAQNSILTANAFFRKVSDNYAAISDYEAAIKIIVGDEKMEGVVSFKRPNLLRIDFSDPKTQVICFNGDLLTIYLPGSQAILNQSVQSGDETASGANLATPKGLSLMSRYYSIAYETGQDPVPLEEDSDEKVVKLVLARKTASEGFRLIRLSVNPASKLIRRVEATTTKNQKFTFDFTEYALNQKIPDTRFIYDTPSSANKYNNFLYSE